MASVSSVDLPLLDEWGHERGRLTIAALPNDKNERSIICGDDPNGEIEDVRVVEGAEYLYILTTPHQIGPFDTDHPEIFIPDTETGDRGRLRTGLHTGAVEVLFSAASQNIGKVCFEVISTKLSYLTDYQWMLRDIAEVCTELVMDRFGPAAGRFSVDDGRDTEALYQRFAFLRSVLEGDEFRAAISDILTSPHVTWEDVDDVTWHSRAMRPSSRVAQSLARPGPRMTSAHALVAELDSLPRRLTISRAATSLDNVPNRFVKWLLQEWLALVARVAQAIEFGNTNTAFARRGKREISAATRMLEGLLDDDIFREIGELRLFPEANQVLQKREGYRYLFRTHLQLEAAARLYWPGLDPVYRAGQRNVAKLYEYWVYLQLGRIVARMCGQTFDARRLIKSSRDGLTLYLQAREETMVSGQFVRFGQRVHIESWFNKSFGMSTPHSDGSWTRPLRPDCSLRVEVQLDDGNSRTTWIHFDAKYRIDRLEETFGRDDDGDDEDANRSRFRREDLLKMHAYKDAIRNSAGAYVVFPGTEDRQPFRQYHELLPGLGAFALRPASAGESRGSNALATFIERVIDHLALQATQYARARFWTERTYQDNVSEIVLPAAPFLKEPPADITVLLGHAKSAAHRIWIKKNRLYNLRADPERGGAVAIHGQELGVRHLVVFGDDQNAVELYCIVDAPRIVTSKQLRALNYPEPRGNHYLCLSLEPLAIESAASWLDAGLVVEARTRKNPDALFGAPMVVTWLDLCLAIS